MVTPVGPAGNDPHQSTPGASTLINEINALGPYLSQGEKNALIQRFEKAHNEFLTHHISETQYEADLHLILAEAIHGAIANPAFNEAAAKSFIKQFGDINTEQLLDQLNTIMSNPPPSWDGKLPAIERLLLSMF